MLSGIYVGLLYDGLSKNLSRSRGIQCIKALMHGCAFMAAILIAIATIIMKYQYPAAVLKPIGTTFSSFYHLLKEISCLAKMGVASGRFYQFFRSRSPNFSVSWLFRVYRPIYQFQLQYALFQRIQFKFALSIQLAWTWERRVSRRYMHL